ncbi:(deoxy)nucleoside triphosphate pyrophosphohydrolase [Corynebacterium renale]|uniref:(deoxy)nucleoside triphosphate pyrophosphohydrolase n=1 Tax=Corynebacterium renale TaxID=1724 RepID=UPI000DBE4F5B|nr:(deoxy)nucleoside triphosphate pyrophosphohydrolase [Corynebacterium renale]
MSSPIHVVAAVFTRREPTTQVFAARRGPGQSMAGLWEFPGGKVEPGESEPQALARELAEELLITARVESHVVTTEHAYDFGTIRLSSYYCAIAEGAPTMTEHDEVRWVDVDKLLQLEWAPADVPAVRAVMEELGR